MRPVASASVASLIGLVACSPSVEKLTADRAIHWLRQACGVQLSTAPAVVDGKESFSTAPHGVANYAYGTVHVSAADWGGLEAAIAGAAGIHKVQSGAGGDHYESFEGSAERRTCVVDNAAHTLYFEFQD